MACQKVPVIGYYGCRPGAGETARRSLFKEISPQEEGVKRCFSGNTKEGAREGLFFGNEKDRPPVFQLSNNPYPELVYWFFQINMPETKTFPAQFRIQPAAVRPVRQADYFFMQSFFACSHTAAYPVYLFNMLSSFIRTFIFPFDHPDILWG